MKISASFQLARRIITAALLLYSLSLHSFAAETLYAGVRLIGICGPSIDGIEVDGTTVYAYGGNTLRMIDYRDPRHPQLLGAVAIDAERFESVVIDRNHVYIGTVHYGGVAVVDTTDKLHPVLYETHWGGNTQTMVTRLGNYLEFASYGRLGTPFREVVRLTTHLSPDVIDGFRRRTDVTDAIENTYITDGERILTYHKVKGICHVADATTSPARELLTSSIEDVPEEPFQIQNGNVTFCGHPLPGIHMGAELKVLDYGEEHWTTPSLQINGKRIDLRVTRRGVLEATAAGTSEPLSRLQLSISAQQVKVAGNIAFVAGGTTVSLVDCAIPQSPRCMASAGFAKSITSYAIEDDQLYVATEDKILQTLHWDQQSGFTRETTQTLPAIAENMAVATKRLFIAAGVAGLLSCDLSDPTHPVLRGAFTPEAGIGDLTTSGSQVFACNMGAIYALQADATSFTLQSQLPVKWEKDQTPYGENGDRFPTPQLKRSGSTLFLINHYGNSVEYNTAFKTIAIDSHSKLTVVAEINGDSGENPDQNQTTLASGALTLVVSAGGHTNMDNSRELHCYDVTDPAHPRRFAKFTRLTFPHSTQLTRNLIYIPDYDKLLILQRIVAANKQDVLVPTLE